LPHLEAALTLWDYCSYSATSLFGDSVGDSVADRIREALQVAPEGLTREQIRKLFNGHVSSAFIGQALEKLSSLGVATSRFLPGRGRSTILWSAIDCQYAHPTQEETEEAEEAEESYDELP
jgi:hypothetical protein